MARQTVQENSAFSVVATVVDQDGKAIDCSACTTKTVHIAGAGASSSQATTTVSGASNNIITGAFAANVATPSGRWEWSLYLVDSNQSIDGYTKPVRFDVLPNIV